MVCVYKDNMAKSKDNMAKPKDNMAILSIKALVFRKILTKEQKRKVFMFFGKIMVFKNFGLYFFKIIYLAKNFRRYCPPPVLGFTMSCIPYIWPQKPHNRHFSDILNPTPW